MDHGKFSASGLSGSQSDPTIFGLQVGLAGSDTVDSVPRPRAASVDAPEKKLTLFALRLAVLEKAATSIGTLGFIWATVVLLGGFAIKLGKEDFLFITIILLIEGTRIFSRSHELEWQRQATWSIGARSNSFKVLKSTSHFLVKSARAIFSPGRNQDRRVSSAAGNANAEINRLKDLKRMPSRKWTESNVPLLPYAPLVFLSKNASLVLYWLQLLSAIACVVLSLMRLIQHNFGEVDESDKQNRKAALIIFYDLALAEAMFFLLERLYWEWKVTIGKLLEKVNRECGFGPQGIISIRRFFYDAYSKCVYGSIFDGLKMDMVSFGMELLASSSPDEQLIGARILLQFATNEQLSDETLKNIGINLSVVERFVEILNWNDPEDEEIRQSAAEILSRLAGKKQNSLRVAGIPGAMESIASLLYTHRGSNGASYEINEKCSTSDQGNYGFEKFNQLGLLLLKKLARDHDNCGKIGNTRGLLPKIIDFAHAEERVLKNDIDATASQIQIVKRALQLVKMLVSTTGNTGKHLRKEISHIVFTISSIRDILRHGEKHPKVQKLGIEILTSLALDVEATEKIGSTGGVLKELFNIFFKEASPLNQNPVRTCAGEALAMLALESKGNCRQIMKLGYTEMLVKSLEDPLLRIHAARIFWNLCTYIGDESINQLKGVTAAAPTVLREVLFTEETRLHETMVGLMVHILKFMNSEESSLMFKSAGIQEEKLADALVQILKKHPCPPIKVPRIRRFAIEIIIWMMKGKDTNAQVFKDLGLKEELHGVLETTDEIENFNIFSGTVGLFPHRTTVALLAETAIGLLAD